MTRQDYERLARALGNADTSMDSIEGKAGVLTAALRIADELEDDNPRFDRERFLKAVVNYGNAHSIKLNLERRMGS